MNSLPTKWVFATLGDVCSRPQYGWTCKASKKGKLKILRTTDTSKNRVDWNSVPYCSIEPKDADQYKIEINDILVSRAGSVGVSYRVDNLPVDAIFASYLIRFKPISDTHPKYIEFYLQSDAYWRSISEYSAGIAVPNVNASKLSKLLIPIPPLNEQQRIVAKLEKLMAKVDQCKARLEKIPTILKRFRQSVLAAACSGGLTKGWREHNSGIEDAGTLLNRIIEERIHKHNLERCISIKAGKKKPKKIDLSTEVDESTIAIRLPNKWKLTNLESVCLDIVDCPHSTPKWNTKGKICLRATNFRPQQLDWSEVHFVSETTYKSRINRLKPRLGDILYSREGGILGIACLLDRKVDVCLGQRMMLIRPSINTSNMFLNFLLNSPLVLRHVQSLIGGSASPHVNVGDIKKYPIPLPPLKEQQEIVRRVEALFKIADQIEERYNKAKAYVDKLTQSILAKAFRGELVPQDPNDPPASELLARIKAEKKEIEAQRPDRRKKAKN
ncbi:putative Type-1 restriction enzyme EcoKI specificity protein [uncultured Desulfobacterium sp.]|uniref:Putative Type-1 restriction enzyme EcoKI specificity protein n=1 Tax=uncultured Desulfobacterium sp. TaxID=201089 RepID=A0A445MXB3_9BACT|nr:putative Type-1 restriction enzyme EcoKI specificity protein [uncultured Desulfobacterium sp.]